MTPTPEQIAAFALLDRIAQPLAMATILQQGDRKNWVDIDAAVETLRPLFVAPPPAPPTAP